MKKYFENENELERLKLILMGKGGLSLAAKAMGISLPKLSRLLNGWLMPTEDDLTKLKTYLAHDPNQLSLLDQESDARKEEE